ncbi:hypothetical protein DID76_02655, partial [Candidatus Marinamargulisbacteria bacterium SCGC AG-414-C22]
MLRQVMSIICCLLLSAHCLGFGTWTFTGNNHPELEWQTLSTEHFNVHFHQGLEDKAQEALLISEQARPTLMKQIRLTDLPVIDIILTREDSILNGFAMPHYVTFIWVDQNDAAIWLEKGKWLEQVLLHELQHLAYFHKMKSWLGQPFTAFLSGVPGWFVEGLAEFETEQWRPYRSEFKHRERVYLNQSFRDPHHSGYSKILYWVDRFGEDSILETLEFRTPLGLPNFKQGFKKSTGITVAEFNKEWKRFIRTYYFSLRSQKEHLSDVSSVKKNMVKKLTYQQESPTQNNVAIIGKLTADQ